MKDFFGALKYKRARREYIKSLIVGALTNLLDIVLTAIILYFFYSAYYSNLFVVPFTANDSLATSIFVFSTIIGWTAAFALNYFLCVFIVFEHGNVGRSRSGFIKFMIFGAIGIVLNILLTLLGVSAIGGDPWIVKIVVMCILFVYNFFTRKYFVFNLALIRDDENTIRL